MKADHERVTKLLTDTVTLLCKNGLSYDRELKIQGLLGITVDSSDIFLVPINDTFSGSSSSSTLTPVPSPVATSTAASSVQSRKRLGSDDIVDLTRLVETPNVHIGGQPAQQPSSVSPMRHGTPARPRSAGSLSQTRSHAVASALSNLTSNRHLQAVARQPLSAAVVTCEHYVASSVHRNSDNNQHYNALALALRPGQRPRSCYSESIQNMIMTCERHCFPRGQGHQQLPPGQTGAWQQHTIQNRQMHQNMLGSMPGAAADTLPTVAIGRPGAEHFSIPPHVHRQPMPGDACVRRSDANPLHLMHTSTIGVAPPPTVSRPHHPGTSRPAHRDATLPWHYIDNMQQVQSAAEGRQLVNTAHYHPPAKRHVPNHMPRQIMQPYNPSLMHSRLPPPYDDNQYTHSSLPIRQACSITNPCGPDLLPTSSISTSQSVSVTSSLDVKPLSSSVQSGRRSRSRHVEHIDLCNDDEAAEIADSEISLPLSSIVIQPDDTDFCAAVPDGAERSNAFVNMSDMCDVEFETAVDNILPENDLLQLTHIHEIVPLDDGFDNEDDELSIRRSRVATENTVESMFASVSVASEASGSVNEQSSAPDSNVSASQLNIAGDQHSAVIFSQDQICIDSGLAQFSPDESRQMAELCFNAEET